jgi:hypothetical protein
VRFALWAVILTAVIPARAEPRSRAVADAAIPVTSQIGILKTMMRQMVHHSEKVFAGTVLKIERTDQSRTGGLATTQIAFRVEDGIRGVKKGEVIQIKEWAAAVAKRRAVQTRRTRTSIPILAKQAGAHQPGWSTTGRFQIDRDRRVHLKTPSGVRALELKSFAAAIRRAAKE